MSTQSDGAVPPAPQPSQPRLRTQGEVYVLLHACGYRIDELMGHTAYNQIRTRLQVAGLLREDGEPTKAGDVVARQFLETRKAAESAEATNPNPNTTDHVRHSRI